MNLTRDLQGSVSSFAAQVINLFRHAYLPVSERETLTIEHITIELHFDYKPL